MESAANMPPERGLMESQEHGLGPNKKIIDMLVAMQREMSRMQEKIEKMEAVKSDFVKEMRAFRAERAKDL